jgi:hypothetical protein
MKQLYSIQDDKGEFARVYAESFEDALRRAKEKREEANIPFPEDARAVLVED